MVISFRDFMDEKVANGEVLNKVRCKIITSQF